MTEEEAMAIEALAVKVQRIHRWAKLASVPIAAGFSFGTVSFVYVLAELWGQR